MKSRVELSEDGTWYLILEVDGCEWAVETQPAEAIFPPRQDECDCPECETSD
jgi:hypothetical protein